MNWYGNILRRLEWFLALTINNSGFSKNDSAYSRRYMPQFTRLSYVAVIG